MIAPIKTWMNTNRFLVYCMLVVMGTLSVAGFKLWYDVTKRNQVINTIVVEETELKMEGLQRVHESDEYLSTIPDCTILSGVYGSDQCERGPHLPPSDIQETRPPSYPYLDGVGSADPVTGESTVPMGGVLQGETVDGVCPEGWTIVIEDGAVGCIPFQ